MEKNKKGEEVKVFGFGAGNTLNKGIINSIKYAFIKFYSVISSMALIIIKLFSGNLSLKSLAGPGIQNLIYLTAYLSVNVGFINVIPFPAFDGGRILFVLIEKIKGSPVSPKVENIIHTIGFALLMLLMVLVTYQDILRLLHR